MAEQTRGVKGRAGQIIQGWAVYRLDDKGALLGISHVCTSELEAKATQGLSEEAATVTVEMVTLILDNELSPHILGPAVKLMNSSEVSEWVREQAKQRLGSAALELLVKSE